MATDTWAAARNVLCVRLDTIGDVLMTTPALRALKESAPGRRLTLLTSPAGADVARLVELVDDVLCYDAPWMKATAPRSGPQAEFEMVRRLADRGFDAAVIFTVFSQNPLPAALLCYLAAIPLRLAHCHENPYQLLTDWIKDPEPAGGIRHEVRRQLDLVAAVGCRPAEEQLSLAAPPAAWPVVRRLLARKGLALDRPWLLAHPGATAPSRRYPPELFARVIAGLVEAGYQVVLSGGPEEHDLVETVRAAAVAPTVSVAGQLDLGQMAALVAAAPLLVSNNTGPVHMAAALGTPVVDIYALTNPQHTPWAVPCRVLSCDVPCKNCFRSVCPMGHHDCLRRVAPSDVIAAALDLLSETRSAARAVPLATP